MLKRIKDNPESIEKMRARVIEWWKSDKEVKSKNIVEKTRKLYKENPELRAEHQKNRTKALNQYEVRLKASRTNGGKTISAYKKGSNEYVGTWQIMSDCARQLKVHTSKIIMILRGERTHTHGYYFKYEEN